MAKEQFSVCYKWLLTPKFLSGFILMIVFVTPALCQDSTVRPADSVPAVQTSAIVRDSTIAPVRKKPVVQKKKDSIEQVRLDSTLVPPQEPVNRDFLLAFQKALAANSYFNFPGKPIIPVSEPHQVHPHNILFYVLIAILFIFAFIKLWFGKYLANLFTLFFQVSMRQHQIREQVLQAPLPSLLLNGLFIITGGMYGGFLLRYYGFGLKTDFWLLFVNCAAVLSVIYLVKFLLLKFAGWIFGISNATDTYIFIVFLTNKILGIFFLPFLIMLSFSSTLATEILMTLSLAMVFLFYAYRVFVSFGPVRKEIKVNAFHFFLYLCAFEIAPLLLIYKVLLNYLEKAY